MNTPSPRVRIHQAALATLLGALLVACGSPAPTGDEAPTPAPETAPAAPAPTSDTPTPASPPPEPTPDAPTEPASVSDPVLAQQPRLESMKTARAPAKASVPVDLKYSFEIEPSAGQPVTLHLAAVPRVAGTNLTVNIKPVDGIRVDADGALNVQKASAQGAYRQQFSVTRQASAPAELRVLVTMDLPQGSAFGFFSIPLEAGTMSQKQDSVKQR
jgi:hypothetical protein